MEKGPYTVTITAFVDEADQWGNSWPVPEISSDLREIGYQIVGWPENRLENSGDQAGDEARDLYGIIKFTIPKDKQKSLEESDNPKQLVLLQFRSVLDKYSTSLNNIQVQGFEKTSGDKEDPDRWSDEIYFVHLGAQGLNPASTSNWIKEDLKNRLHKNNDIAVQKIQLVEPKDFGFLQGKKQGRVWFTITNELKKEKSEKELKRYISNLANQPTIRQPALYGFQTVEEVGQVPEYSRPDRWIPSEIAVILPTWVKVVGVSGIILYTAFNLFQFEIGS